MNTADNRGIGVLFLTENPHLPLLCMRAVCVQPNHNDRSAGAVIPIDTKPQLVRERGIVGAGHNKGEGVAEDQTVELLCVNDFACWVAFGEDGSGFVGCGVAALDGDGKNDNKDEEKRDALGCVAGHERAFLM